MLFQTFLYVFKITAPDLKIIKRWEAMEKLQEGGVALDHVPRVYAYRLLRFRSKLCSTNVIICTILLTNTCWPLGISDDLTLFFIFRK